MDDSGSTENVAVLDIQNKRSQQVDRVDKSCKELFLQKNDQYDDTIAATGVLGASVELLGAASRLKKLVLKDPKHGESNAEVLIDVLKDLHNYANIALIMLSEDNWSGK